jgi:4-amino-4-deoxy-L-arabinose transferase-like glycosyltransferase
MSARDRLGWPDYLLLALFYLVLCSFPLFNGRTFTTHETVHCQNVREMIADGDWIIPHYGGRPWMERPPLPFWITMGVVELVGDRPASYRLASLLAGLPCVLLVGGMACRWFGRGIGLAAGLILATMQEFTHYSTGPEADIFLCLIVTAAIALFVHLEFDRRPAGDGEDSRFLGRRPWPVLAFFAVLGLANLAKGLFFGDLFVILPIGSYLLANRDAQAIRRYVWLPGWLTFLAVAAAWPVAAYLRYPDVLDFWKHDYLGRVNQGYMKEPVWYYFAHLPLVTFPWSIPALYGMWLSRRSILADRSPERFLWCWAAVPILFFSIPQGKHHHYLLQGIAPWAVLAALGAARLWCLAQNWTWLHRPWLVPLGLALAGDAAIVAFAARLPGPPWMGPALLAGWPITVYTAWWAVTCRDARSALGALCILVTGLYWAGYAYRTAYWDRYRDDSIFLEQVKQRVPTGEPILVMDDDAPLNASWLLFYAGRQAELLHNITFLLDDRVPDRDVYLIARRKVEKALPSLGQYEELLESRRSRYERTPEDRYRLYRVRVDRRLARHHGVRISPMQATGRAYGPYLVMIDGLIGPPYQ